MQHIIQRTQILLAQDRYEEAIKEVKKGLAENPQEAVLYALLSQSQLADRQFSEGLQSAQQAISLNPEAPLFYLVLGKAQYFNKRIEEGKRTLRTGLSMDPEDPDFFYWLGQIDMYEENWELALDNAEQGLALNAEDVSLLNLRAEALIKLNRQSDAQQSVDDALRRSPENSYSHANKAYSLLHAGELDKSLEQFREALRLDPTNEFAKGGLKEAIKGKNLLYRGIQKYFLWMERMQSKYQWGFIIGIYILYRIILSAMESMPNLAPFLMPLAIFYVIFAFSTWIAKPISNLALRFHPLGKLALSMDEKIGSKLVAVLGILLLLCLLLYFIGFSAKGDSEFWLYAAGYFGLSMIPVSGMFNLPEGTKARTWLMYYSIFLLLVGGIYVFILPQYTILLMIFALGIFVYGFVANYLVQLSAKEF